MTRAFRVASLLAAPACALAIAAAAVAGAGCSGGGKKTAHLDGHVHDPANVMIPGATIAVDGSSTTSAADGSFALDASAGTRHVHAEASGYYPTDAQVPLAAGDNAVDLTLLPCDPGDPTCPPASSPTPTPQATPNITLTFNGVNLQNTVTNLNAGSVPPWTGDAVDSASGKTFGAGNGTDFTFTECFADSAEQSRIATGAGQTYADIDHCIVDFVLVGGATVSGYDGAFIELSVPGSVWAGAAPDNPAATTIHCTVADSTCSLAYWEYVNNVGSNRFFTAQDGSADIVVGGYGTDLGSGQQQPVQIANGSFTAPDFP